MGHTQAEIVSVEQELRQAMAKNDLSELERLLHDELLFTDFTGAVVGKNDDLAAHASGAVAMTEVEFVEEPMIRLYGEMAIVAVKAHLKGTSQGSPFAGFYRYLRVWLFQKERWQVISGNVSMIA